MSIKFIVDSMCDTSDAVFNKYSFDVLPIPISMDSKTYFDGVDISSSMVIDYVQKNPKDFPKTSQVQTLAYLNAFEAHLKNGDDVIYLALSSELSGTCQTAEHIAQDLLKSYPDRKISVVDSKCATTAIALILHQGLKLNKLGRPFKEIVETLHFLARHVRIYFIVGDINWLAKGGRVHKGIAQLASMLKIVPILHFQEGKIVIFEKLRGEKKALKRIFEAVDVGLGENTNQIIGIINSTNISLQDKVIKQLKKQFGLGKFIIPEKGAGSALTVHIGPRCIGVMFFDALPENYVPVIP